MKKIALLGCLLILTISLYSQVPVEPAGGDGSEENPFEISSLENLFWIAYDPDRWSLHYIQINDIDASETAEWFDGLGWAPIGKLDPPFTGQFNGQGHIIEGLYINRPENSYLGLFGRTSGAIIENTGLVDLNITGGSIIGGIVGFSSDDSSIINCYTTGNLHSTFIDSLIGGLAGRNHESVIEGSFSTADVSGFTSVGGLVGDDFSSTIVNCYSTGNISGEIGGWGVGGLIGDQLLSSVSSSYSTGNVNGSSGAGGIVGMRLFSSLTDSYSTGFVSGEYGSGGLIGIDIGSTIANCFSSSEVFGDYYSGGLVGFLTYTPDSKNCSLISKVPDRYVKRYNFTKMCRNDFFTIESSYSTGDISGYFYIGGLVGHLTHQAIINNNFSSGNVSGFDRIGGLVGYLHESVIINSFSMGNVTGEEKVGGLAGHQFESSATNSYWNMDTSGQGSSAAGEGRTTAQMTYPYADNTYVEWDFDDIWSEDNSYEYNNGYPYLQQTGSVSVEETEIIQSEQLYLSNYPNPFNPVTRIVFRLPESVVNLQLKVYNIRGSLVKTLIPSGFYHEGEHKIAWDGKNELGRPVSSGFYFYRLNSEKYEKTGRMLLLK